MLFQITVVVVILSIGNIGCAPAEPKEPTPVCNSAQYMCQHSSPGLLKSQCIAFDDICNGVKDCVDGEDEDNEVCKSSELIDLFRHHSRRGTLNEFAGTGFVFNVGTLIISNGSRAHLFDQQSNNIALQNSQQHFTNQDDPNNSNSNDSHNQGNDQQQQYNTTAKY
ncbi:uncharacterized protein LOC128956335 [Oppia nitens]|uniref:uncharacterized protein LOC128956335 n=1 Tax=Oppia nitens TaxID=1686743 RepID=UPI0023DAD358|nr:uncharacterized protein LOC128956335 [Oppia nitens]